MLEKEYKYSVTDGKIIEILVDDDDAMINHIVLSKGDVIPEHFTNSNVYLIVSLGTISLQLQEQETHKYPKGSIVNIPYNTKMNISNTDEDVLEFFIVKAPNPRVYKAK